MDYIGYIFKYATGEKEYLDPNILINRINGINTNITQSIPDSSYIISKKINRPVQEITFKDIKKKIEELNYDDNLNKMLSLNKEYLDAILYLIVDDSLRMDDYDKIMKAESSEERKFLIIDLLKKAKCNTIFRPFFNRMPVKNLSTKVKIRVDKPTDIRALPKSTVGIVALPYTFPKVSEDNVINSIKTIGSTKFVGNSIAKEGFKFNSAENAQVLLGKKQLQRSETKRYFTTEICLMNLTDIVGIENEMNNGAFSSNSLQNLAKLSVSNIEVKRLKIHKKDESPIDYYILQDRLNRTFNNAFIDKYEEHVIYYIRNADGSYADANIKSEQQYNAYSEPLYRKATESDLIPCISHFGTGLNYKEIEQFIDTIDENFDESRVYNDKNREKYKQELIAKIEKNADLLKPSLYKPVIIDGLKNYIDWLFDDGFYVDGKQSLVFPYYISSECENYLGPAAKVQKTLKIYDELSDIYGTKGDKRIQNVE